MLSNTKVNIFFVVLMYTTTLVFCSSINYNNHDPSSYRAKLGQFPYAVIVKLSYSSVRDCVGTIISSKHVLTNGECRSPTQTPLFYEVVTAIVLENGKEKGQKYPVRKFVAHPEFRFYAKTYKNNIALIETRDEMVFTANVSPIQLGRAYIDGDLEAVSIGFGSMDNRFFKPMIYTTLKTVNNKKCRKVAETPERVYDTVLCASSSHEGVEQCGRGEGAPLVFNNTLIGIGSLFESNCGKTSADMYTRVSEFIDWIEGQMGATNHL